MSHILSSISPCKALPKLSLLLAPLVIMSALVIMCQPSATLAHTRVITIDESTVPSAPDVRKVKADKNTRVINIKGGKKDVAPASSGGGEDICPGLGGYYCKSVGREAWLAGVPNGFYLGRIVGVVWKDKDDVMGQYLQPSAEATLSAGTLKDALLRNHLSAMDSFYLIIEVKGLEGLLLVEPHRITIE